MFKKVYLLISLMLLALICGCSDLSSTTTGGNLSSLSISPTSANVRVGSSETFSATGNYSDGTTLPVIPTWTVSNGLGTIITVGYSGLFTATTVGTGSVTATYGGKSASASISVEGSAAVSGLTTIEVSPPIVLDRVKAVQTFTAAGTGLSGESIAISPSWSIAGDPIGIFSSNGLTATLEATGEGTAVISCTSFEVTGYSYVTIEGFFLDITVESDTYVDSSNPSTSYGSQTSMKAGYLSAGTGTFYESYLRFSLASVPSNVTIESATIFIYPAAVGTPPLQFHNMSSAFTEETTSWSNKPSQGNFIFSKTFTAGEYNTLSGDELLSVVRSWYAAPSSNYGLAIGQDVAENGVVSLLSKENGSNPPVLDIEYKKL